MATRTLQDVAERSGLELGALAERRGVLRAEDFRCRRVTRSAARGRCRPFQLDFFEPERFDSIHRARRQPQAAGDDPQGPVGSIERFFGVLTEHYAGAFPAWLAPVRVIGLPVADEFNDYLGGCSTS